MNKTNAMAQVIPIRGPRKPVQQPTGPQPVEPFRPSRPAPRTPASYAVVIARLREAADELHRLDGTEPTDAEHLAVTELYEYIGGRLDDFGLDYAEAVSQNDCVEYERQQREARERKEQEIKDKVGKIVAALTLARSPDADHAEAIAAVKEAQKTARSLPAPSSAREKEQRAEKITRPLAYWLDHHELALEAEAKPRGRRVVRRPASSTSDKARDL